MAEWWDADESVETGGVTGAAPPVIGAGAEVAAPEATINMEVVEELRRWIEEEVVVQHLPRAVTDLTAAKDSTIPVKLEAAGHHFKKKKYSRCSGSVDTRTHSNFQLPTS